MSRPRFDIFIENGDINGKGSRHNSDLSPSCDGSKQQVLGTKPLTPAEKNIMQTIDSCFKSWHERWITTFLEDKREFRIVYDLMEGLLHYGYQITNTETNLSSDRTSAIAQAVARLVDYGNSLLGLDLIIRACDETSSELDPLSVTTIELFQAHIKAHNLREKLLYDYFKKDKPSPTADDTTSISSGTIPLVTLQIPSNSQQPNQSPVLERSHKSSLGSSTSINSLSEGRKTPQPISSLLNQIELQTTPTDHISHSVEVSHMIAAIRSSAFSASQSSATRLSILPGLMAKIENLMSVPANHDKVATCFDILDALFESIEKLPIESRGQEVTVMANSLLRPLVKKMSIDDRDNLVEFQQAHWTTCLISMIRLMTASDFINYLKRFTSLLDLSDFIKDYLFVIKRIMCTSKKTVSVSDPERTSPDIYPDCWIEMILLSCSTFLKSLTSLFQIVRQHFGSKLEMWSIFIDCLIHFILHNSLNPNRYMLKERQSVLAEELRQNSALYVRLSWNSFNYDQKQQLLEDIIDPLLRASMILHSKQRSILLPIFHDMMRCDYTNQYVLSKGSEFSYSTTLCDQGEQPYSNFIYDEDLDGESLPPTIIQANSTCTPQTNESLPFLSCNDMSEDGTVLTKFTHLIVGKLNTLMFDHGLGDELFKVEFCAAIAGDLNLPHQNLNTSSNPMDTSQFKSMARHTSNLMAEFLQICLDARLANKLSYKHLYLLCLFKLILFFRDKVDRIELYLSNLYKLCYLHHTAQRYVEAGYTLLEHAKSLPWSDKPLEKQLYRIVMYYFQTSEPLHDYSSLKIFLYNSIMAYFDQGQVWEAAVPLCRELIDIYQFKTYQYDKLAQILQKLSNYFSNITEPGQRSDPEYFRVTFYGLGFPKTLQNATMIYRGKPYEKLGDFQNTMLCKYPDAKLLHSLAKPDEALLNDPESRFLQINACSPVIDLKARFGNELSKVDEYILNYYRHNECDKFNFSRKIKRPDYLKADEGRNGVGGPEDNFANIWRERTILTTNTLPNMLPFFPVYLIETKIVSPIESAIEDLERTNDRLSCMVNRFRADKRQAEDVRLLGQLLLGIVDAAVNGGITKYEEAFFTSKPSKVATTTTASALESSLEGLCLSNENDFQPIHGKQQAAKIDNHSSGDVDRPSGPQVDKLKCLIAGQAPLLDEAIRLHRDRVADVMRPQHDHLESSYKELKRHIMSKYSRYLPSDYNRSTTRSYRSLARSPNRSTRSDSRGSLLMMSSNALGCGLANRFALKRMSDVGTKSSENNNEHNLTSCSIPYRQLSSERRSLPFLTGADPVADRGGDVGPANNLRQQSPLPPVSMSGFTARDQATLSNPNNGSYSSELPTMRDQSNRPIPARRVSVNMRAGDGAGTLYTDESRLSYTRFVCDDGHHNSGQNVSDRKRQGQSNSETEACLLIEDQ